MAPSLIEETPTLIADPKGSREVTVAVTAAGAQGRSRVTLSTMAVGTAPKTLGGVPVSELDTQGWSVGDSAAGEVVAIQWKPCPDRQNGAVAAPTGDRRCFAVAGEDVQYRKVGIEERVRLSYLSGAPDGPRSMTATAWAVRGTVPI